MPSSVTVDDDLRRRIKKLAAELDTSQGEVVAKAITLIERELSIENTQRDPEARKMMQKAALKRKNIPWRQEIRKKLSGPGLGIEDMRIASWKDFDENQS